MTCEDKTTPQKPEIVEQIPEALYTHLRASPQASLVITQDPLDLTIQVLAKSMDPVIMDQRALALAHQPKAILPSTNIQRTREEVQPRLHQI